MTTEEIRLCQKADAAVGEILESKGVPRYMGSAYPTLRSYGKSLLRRVVSTVVLGTLTVWGYCLFSKSNLTFGTFGAAVIVALILFLLSELFVGLVNESDKKLQARWLRIGKLLHSMWGEERWQVSSAESLRLQVLARLELELWNTEGPSLPLARCIALKAWQIEHDLHLSLVPVTERDVSHGEPTAKPGVV